MQIWYEFKKKKKKSTLLKISGLLTGASHPSAYTLTCTPLTSALTGMNLHKESVGHSADFIIHEHLPPEEKAV